MNAYAMTNEQITAYREALRLEEGCEATVQKYVSAVIALFRFLPPEKTVTQEFLLAWKPVLRAVDGLLIGLVALEYDIGNHAVIVEVHGVVVFDKALANHVALHFAGLGVVGADERAVVVAG